MIQRHLEKRRLGRPRRPEVPDDGQPCCEIYDVMAIAYLKEVLFGDGDPLTIEKPEDSKRQKQDPLLKARC